MITVYSIFTASIRKTWTAEEREAVLRHFADHILMERLPVKREVDKCKKMEKYLSERTWKNIKDFVRNRIQTQKKKKTIN